MRKVNPRRISTNLEDQVRGILVHERTCIKDDAAFHSASIWKRREPDTGWPDVLDPDEDFGALRERVEADLVRNEFLLQAAEVEVSTIAQELFSVILVADLQRVSAQEVQELGEDVCGSIWDAGRGDGWRAEEAVAIEAREYLRRGCEKGAEAEGEEVGAVAWTREDIAGDLEVAVADLDEDLGFE